MKKKFLAIYALTGALVASPIFTSCVDDNESGTVTQLREAKLAQMKSVTALNEANAEAALIIANAEKALKEAEAAYQNALAEGAAMNNEIVKARLANDIEAAKANAEAALYTAQANLADAKAKLEIALDVASNAQKERINVLITKASTVLENLQTARNNKINANAEIIALKAELISVTDYVATETKRQQRLIADKEAFLTEISKYESSTQNKDDALKAYNEANALAESLKAPMREADIAKQQAEEAFMQLEEKRWSYELYNKTNTYYNTQGVEIINIFTDKNIQISNDTYWDNWDGDRNHYYIKYSEDCNLTLSDGSTYYNKKNVLVYNVKADEATLTQNITDIQQKIDIQELKVKEAEAALKTITDGDAYKNAVKDVTDKQKAYDDAKAATTTTSAQLEAAQNALNAAIATRDGLVSSAQDNIKDTQSYLETLKNDLADAQELKELLTGQAATDYAAYVAEYKKAWEELNKATLLAYLNAQYAYNQQSAIANSLQQIANATTDYAEIITLVKKDIASYERKIAELKDISNKEEAIKQQEEKLAAAETNIKVYEAQYKDYMSQIEALIGSEE